MVNCIFYWNKVDRKYRGEMEIIFLVLNIDIKIKLFLLRDRFK